MTEKPIASIIHHYSSIEDPRVDRQKKHPLQDIFFIALCADICGADNGLAIEEFGKAKIGWLTKLLGLQHGIPAHDTFGDVFAAIDNEQFGECFSNRVSDLASLTDGEVIAMDGKCLRRSLDKASKKAAILGSVHGRSPIAWFWVRLKGTINPMKLRPFPSCYPGWLLQEV